MSSAFNSYRNSIRSYYRRLNPVRPFFYNVENTRSFTRCIIKRESNFGTVLNSQSKIPAAAVRRCLSARTNPDDDSKPSYKPLMESSSEVIWPGFFQMLKCWLTFRLRVVPMDAEFDVVEFIDGTRHAVCTVSDALSKEDYESLDGLVTPEAIEILKRNVARLSEGEKRAISLNEDEFFFAFPWDINVRDAAGGSSKIVEVLMVYHFLPDWKGIQPRLKMMDNDSGMQRIEVMQAAVNDPDYVKKAIVGNYRFIREFGSGESPWFVNFVNHFKISDVQE